MNLTWSAESLLRAVRGQCLHEQTWVAHGVSIDGRTVKAGDVFIALKGPTHDGHDFVGQAFAAGAVAAIVTRNPPHTPSHVPIIYVEDTFTALQDLGRIGRQRARATILAVTGSVGKTSSKEMLRLMLDAVGDTYANEGSLNNHWGVPLSLARLSEDARFGVFEMGMNHAGELQNLTEVVKPHVALITNVEPAHLEHFASVEAIADAKAEIFLGMTADGVAVLNRDNPHYGRLSAAARAQGLKRIVGFGQDQKADARLLDYMPSEDESVVKATILGHTLTYRLGATGVHVAFNSLGTLLAAVMAGGDAEICAAALAHYQPPQGRGTRETVRLEEGTAYVIDETYNANPASMRAALRNLGHVAPKSGGRRIAVLGDMRELGPQGPELHAALAEEIVAQNIDLVHVCGELMMNLYEALPDARRGHHAKDSTTLAPLVTADAKSGDVFMIKGSHSMAMNRIVATLTKQKL